MSLQSFHIDKKWIHYALAGIGLLVILLAVAIQEPVLMLFPVAVSIGILLLKNLSWGHYIFFLLLPFSIEIYLPNGLGTNLPSEPLMWLISVLGVVWLIKRLPHINKKAITHPMSILILAHLAWIAFTAICSSVPLISIKFLLAKSWYLFPFYFLVLFMEKDSAFVRSLFAALGVSLFLVVVFVFIQHASYGFSFRDINKAVSPIFRNHVNYACILVIAIPMIWYLWNVAKKSRWVKVMWLGIALTILAGIYFSYTRAAHVSVFIALLSYFVIRFRIMKWALSFTLIGVLAVGWFFVDDNRFLEYAPQYEKTVTHYQFDDLLSATTKGEDISTMERVYRWVAGWEMFKERPLTGFGPGTYYSNYRSYTISSFQTYVSNNPDHSGIHNYYLMTLAEQGLIGFLIFLLLCFYALWKAEQIYHDCKNRESRIRVMAIALMLVIINAILIINDMLEVDKVGPFYFLGLALLVTQDLKNKKLSETPENISD